MFDFRNAAINETSLSPLMNGREKITVEEIISEYPEGITLTAFDLVSLPKKENPDEYDTLVLFTYEEDYEKCFFGGTVLKKIVDAWVKGYNGDVGLCQADFEASGGIKVILAYNKTRSGNRIVTVEVE